MLNIIGTINRMKYKITQHGVDISRFEGWFFLNLTMRNKIVCRPRNI